jgi:hypothetical protein
MSVNYRIVDISSGPTRPTCWWHRGQIDQGVLTRQELADTIGIATRSGMLPAASRPSSREMSALQVVPARPRGNARRYVSAKAGRAGEVAARYLLH